MGTQYVYRYTTNGEGVWLAGKRLLPNELIKEVNKNRSWLSKPQLPNENYTFWLTKLGKEKYEETLFKTHQKYLTNIKLEEKLYESLGKIIYQDEYQIVELADKTT